MKTSILRLLSVLTLLVILAPKAFAADHKIALKILEKGSARRIEHAVVTWQKQSWDIDADSPSITLPDSARGTVLVRAQGYEAEKLSASDLLHLKTKVVYLFPGFDDDDANTVTVTGERTDGAAGITGDESRDADLRNMAGAYTDDKSAGRQGGNPRQGAPGGRPGRRRADRQ